ncbi:MAG: hypothetical protein K2X67_02705 [Burkholderiales bacterium]|jgi:hypothetical protein|nr:hypothetical protein [Burkholderiales bacterium]
MSEASKGVLTLDLLDSRHPGLTASLAGAYTEAAAVCLGRHHESPVEAEVSSSSRTTNRLIEFTKPDARTLNAWANETDTTEFGAYGVCLAAVEVEEQMVAIRRADTLTGADWYVAPIGSDPQDLENCLRLEVSGVDSGDRSVVAARLRQKVEQARRGASNLPAIASVIGFKVLSIAIQKVSAL